MDLPQLTPEQQAVLRLSIGQGDTQTLSVRLPAGTVAVLEALGAPQNKSAPQVLATLGAQAAHAAVHPTPSLTEALRATPDRIHQLMQAHGLQMHQVKDLGIPIQDFIDPDRLLAWFDANGLHTWADRFQVLPDYLLGATPNSGLPPIVPQGDLQTVGTNAIATLLAQDFTPPDQLILLGAEGTPTLLVCAGWNHHGPFYASQRAFAEFTGGTQEERLTWAKALLETAWHRTPARPLSFIHRLVEPNVLRLITAGHLHPVYASDLQPPRGRDVQTLIGTNTARLHHGALRQAANAVLQVLSTSGHADVVSADALYRALDLPPLPR